MGENCIYTLHNTGHLIGLHSHTHPNQFGRLRKDKQELEYTLNYKNFRNYKTFYIFNYDL